MSLAAGKANSGIAVLEIDGVRLVRREYGSWLGLAKDQFFQDLDALVDCGLISSKNWLWEDLEDGGVAIANPWVDIVAEPDLEPRKEVWCAYARALEGLAKLFDVYGLRYSKDVLISFCEIARNLIRQDIGFSVLKSETAGIPFGFLRQVRNRQPFLLLLCYCRQDNQ